MNQTETGCAEIRELLPDLAAARLDPGTRSRVETHLAGCDACRAEHALVGMLFATRTSPPAGLEARVIEAVERRPPLTRRPWWGLSAAAVAAVALGIGIASDPGTPTSGDAVPIATEFEEGGFWVSDDGLLAGAPALEELSDEALVQLLEELAAETPGGAA